MSDFALWLQALMKRRGLSQGAIATYADVDTSAVSRWLRGSQPKTSSLEKLAGALNEDLPELFRLAGHLPPLDETAGAELHEERSPYDAEISSLARALNPDDLALWVKLGRTMLTHEHEQDL